MNTTEKIVALRQHMLHCNIHALVIPSGDNHLSEFVSPHFQLRAYLSGFDGSAGTLVVGQDWAGLWTDSRYHLQAQAQLQDSPISLYAMGNPDVDTIEETLIARLPQGGVLAADGRTLSVTQAQAYQNAAAQAGATCSMAWTCPPAIWPARPNLPTAPLYAMDNAGQSAQEKLSLLRSSMAKKQAGAYLMTTLSDIAWMLNLRGGDIAHNPTFLSYLFVTPEQATLFIDQSKLSVDIAAYLTALKVDTAPYDQVDDACRRWQGAPVWIAPLQINGWLYDLLQDKRLLLPNPIELAKAQKSPSEIAQLRSCNQRDGVAMVRFMRWLKDAVTTQVVSECSAGAMLDSFRAQQSGNIGLSFDTICAYKEHGAIPHYYATPESDFTLEPHGFLLVDSGGQYTDGTTDITRTIALGQLSAQMRRHYTLVLKGNMALANAIFPHGTTGATLDMLARNALWQAHLNYGHGTGHGIGYRLNVHEGPQNFNYLRTDCPSFEVGMVTSDEPGLYLTGCYGIRLENDLVCQESGNSAFGRFLCFEALTLAPFERAALDCTLLTQEDCQRINDYHAMVYQRLAPLLTQEECAWLQDATSPISPA